MCRLTDHENIVCDHRDLDYPDLDYPDLAFRHTGSLNAGCLYRGVRSMGWEGDWGMGTRGAMQWKWPSGCSALGLHTERLPWPWCRA